MNFVMYAFNNHVKVLRNVTPIDLLAQSEVLSDGVIVVVLHNVTPIDGRIYKSAPTIFINHMAHSGSICAMTVLFQQPHIGLLITAAHRIRLIFKVQW